MKKTLHYLTTITILFLMACNSKKEDTKREMVFLNDSLYKSNLSSDTAVLNQNDLKGEIDRSAQNIKPVNQRIRRIENNKNQASPPIASNPTPSPDPVPSTSSSQPTSTDDNGKATSSGSNNDETEDNEKAVEKKEGISKAAKGAVIGGIGGAVVGAVITKKGKGAVVGGIIGAAGGYILGRKKDKADGRVSNLVSF